MNIGIGKSTSALMIADPLAILEPNEIQLCFSSTFRDPKSRWEDFMLNDIDVLVARLPAWLPSDIQKVSSSQWHYFLPNVPNLQLRLSYFR